MSCRAFTTLGAVLLWPALTAGSFAAEPALPRDGWVSWEVPTPDHAPAYCCFGHWKNGDASPETCHLDQRPEGIGSRGRQTTARARIYARTTAGRLDRLQVLAAGCPVATRTPVRELVVEADDSVRWLAARGSENGTDAVHGQPLAEGALMALALHRGAAARDALARFARQDTRAETRRWAVFWLGVVRGDDGAEIVRDVLFQDRDPEVRGHAAFALAQSGVASAEQTLGTALRRDTDDDVREQVLFALSQLPEGRAEQALIAAAEDRSLPREHRKRAVFWLSQSETQAAADYLDRVLTR